MPHGVHNTAQTAFRLPESLLARLKESAKRHGQTMTDIVVRGIEAELDRLDGGAVSPPRVRESRADTAPPATFREPESAQSIADYYKNRKNGAKT
jgi:hypothetical protein